MDADGSEIFRDLAGRAGNLVGEHELALRKYIGDEWFDNVRSSTMRGNDAQAALQEAWAKRRAAEAAFFSVCSVAVFALTIAACVLVGWIVV